MFYFPIALRRTERQFLLSLLSNSTLSERERIGAIKKLEKAPAVKVSTSKPLLLAMSEEEGRLLVSCLSQTDSPKIAQIVERLKSQVNT